VILFCTDPTSFDFVASASCDAWASAGVDHVRSLRYIRGRCGTAWKQAKTTAPDCECVFNSSCRTTKRRRLLFNFALSRLIARMNTPAVHHDPDTVFDLSKAGGSLWFSTSLLRPVASEMVFDAVCVARSIDVRSKTFSCRLFAPACEWSPSNGPK